MFVHNFGSPWPPLPKQQSDGFVFKLYDKDLKQNCKHSTNIPDKLSQNKEQTELQANGRFW